MTNGRDKCNIRLWYNSITIESHFSEEYGRRIDPMRLLETPSTEICVPGIPHGEYLAKLI